MPDPAERFIDAAVRPLGDNAELEVIATREIRDTLAAHPAPAERLLAATRRLEANPRIRRGWRTSLYLITAVVSAVVLYSGWKNHGMPHQIDKLLPSPGGGISFEPETTWEE